jgi:hypothetical protein
MPFLPSVVVRKAFLGLTVVLAFAGCDRASQDSQSPSRAHLPAQVTNTNQSLPEIASYTNWAKISPENYAISQELSELCISRPNRNVGSAGPHANVPVSVHVNARAAQVFSGKLGKRVFPAGSIIVKAKYRPTNSYGETVKHGSPVRPQELGVMLKREPGFDPGGGDWEYAFVPLDPPGVITRGRMDNCRECHRKQKDADFVFAAYVNRD